MREGLQGRVTRALAQPAVMLIRLQAYKSNRRCWSLAAYRQSRQSSEQQPNAVLRSPLLSIGRLRCALW